MTYDQLCAWDNLSLAWRKAAKGKRGRPAAARFEYHLVVASHIILRLSDLSLGRRKCRAVRASRPR